MPRNKISNDLDHVRKNPVPKVLKERPSKLWPLLNYILLKINNPLTYNQSYLFNTITFNNSYNIFNLFFIEEIL